MFSFLSADVAVPPSFLHQNNIRQAALLTAKGINSIENTYFTALVLSGTEYIIVMPILLGSNAPALRDKIPYSRDTTEYRYYEHGRC